MALTAKRLRELLSYDAMTGDFIRRVSLSPRTAIGSKAGCVDHKGYRQIRVDGKRYAAHRLAFLYQTGVWPGD
jgi:hypothetical protein